MNCKLYQLLYYSLHFFFLSSHAHYWNPCSICLDIVPVLTKSFWSVLVFALLLFYLLKPVNSFWSIIFFIIYTFTFFYIVQLISIETLHFVYREIWKPFMDLYFYFFENNLIASMLRVTKFMNCMVLFSCMKCTMCMPLNLVNFAFLHLVILLYSYNIFPHLNFY